MENNKYINLKKKSFCTLVKIIIIVKKHFLALYYMFVSECKKRCFIFKFREFAIPNFWFSVVTYAFGNELSKLIVDLNTFKVNFFNLKNI